MSSPVHFRWADENDTPALYELARNTLTLDAFSFNLFVEKLTARPWPDPSESHVMVAEADGRIIGLMQRTLRPAVGKAWIGLFAVDERYRRRGIATEMLRRIHEGWPDAVTTAEVLSLPANYLVPGLDPRYAAATGFVERAGFRPVEDCCNLRVELNRRFDTTSDKQNLANAGITVRRAHTADESRLEAFFAVQFGAEWLCEAGMALQRDPPALHLALHNDTVIGFSAHSTQNCEWGFFGPMGTAPPARGRGIGRVLLWRCLNDLRDAGHATAVIPWVGPVAFYQQWTAARVERTFRRYVLDVRHGPRNNPANP